nr:hypothetical protein [Tanacetum cinerariifolium]
ELDETEDAGVVVAEDAQASGDFDVAKDHVDPWYILGVVEHVKRFSESHVSHGIKTREVDYEQGRISVWIHSLHLPSTYTS